MESQFNLVLRILVALGGLTERLGGAIAGFRIKRTTLVFKMNNLRLCRPRHQRSTSEFNKRSGAHRNILCASDEASVQKLVVQRANLARLVFIHTSKWPTAATKVDYAASYR